MRNRLIESVEAAQPKKEIAKFEIGDTVSVGVRILEGTKERVQPFVGLVIARRGKGLSATFTVRRIVNNEGVERIFPLHSPKLAGIEVVRHGKVRRGKLYYLRDRVGKARKLRERRGEAGPGAEETSSERTDPDKPASRSRGTAVAAGV